MRVIRAQYTGVLFDSECQFNPSGDPYTALEHAIFHFSDAAAVGLASLNTLTPLSSRTMLLAVLPFRL